MLTVADRWDGEALAPQHNGAARATSGGPSGHRRARRPTAPLPWKGSKYRSTRTPSQSARRHGNEGAANNVSDANEKHARSLREQPSYQQADHQDERDEARIYEVRVSTTVGRASVRDHAHSRHHQHPTRPDADADV